MERMNQDKSKDVNAKFEMRKAGTGCPMCPDDEDADVVAILPSGRAHLQNDADYRGYCILIFYRHAVELHDLTEEERGQWVEDISRVGRAISDLCGPAKLNVSMLGNMVPHLHCHIIPRYPEDPDWGHPPAYRRPSERRQLPMEEYVLLQSKLIKTVRAQLDGLR
jgi:diadenosine tetraphosphate (Ap4A) HIT family hydrolase